MSSPAASAQLPAAEAATPARTVVHKFGGTSVADAERYRHVAGLLLARDEQEQVTVVSAMKGVTDALIELAKLAASASFWICFSAISLPTQAITRSAAYFSHFVSTLASDILVS